MMKGINQHLSGVRKEFDDDLESGRCDNRYQSSNKDYVSKAIKSDSESLTVARKRDQKWDYKH